MAFKTNMKTLTNFDSLEANTTCKYKTRFMMIVSWNLLVYIGKAFLITGTYLSLIASSLTHPGRGKQ